MKKDNLKFKIILILTIFCAVLLLPKISQAATYYVSPTGTNTWPNCTAQVSPCLADSTPTGKAFLGAVAGDTVYFLAGTYNPGDAPSWAVPAWNPSNSGSEGSSITFKCLDPLTCTVIHNTVGPSIGSYRKDYITWDGFKATKVSKLPFAKFGGEDSGFVDHGTIRNSEITGFMVPITDPIPGDNGPIISGNHASNLLIQNNYFTGNGTEYAPGKQNLAAILFYSVKDSIIEKNTFYNNHAGMFEKNDGQNNTYRYNFFYISSDSNVCHGLVTQQAAGGPATVKRYVYQNIFVSPGGAYAINMGDQPYGGTNIQVYNNTFYVLGQTSEWAVMSYGYIQNLQLWNNLVYGNNYSFRQGSNDKKPTYMDYNIYYGTQKFVVAANQPDMAIYSSLANWQSSGALMDGGNPDTHSYYEDPQFANPGGDKPEDYKINAVHKNNGRGGIYASVIGAYITGNEQIGYLPPQTTDIIPPAPPTGVMVI